MHALSKTIIDRYKIETPFALDQTIRGHMKQRADNIFRYLQLHGFCRNDIKDLLGVASSTIDEKIDDWFEDNQGKHPSGKDWRIACKKAMKEIASEYPIGVYRVRNRR